MGSYTQHITNEGECLIARALNGDILTFSEVVTSSDLVKGAEEEIRSLTEIADIQQAAVPSAATRISDHVIRVSVTFENTNIKNAYEIQTIGLFAKIGEESQRLFAIALAQKPSEMPAMSDTSYASLTFDFNISVQHAKQVAIKVIPGGALPSDVFYDMFPGLNAPSSEDVGKIVQINKKREWEYVKADNALSPESENPVQGKVVAVEFGKYEKVYTAHDGTDFAIPDLGITKESTLKELCEAVISYGAKGNRGITVTWWINSASAIGTEINNKLSFGNGNLEIRYANYTAYLTLRNYYNKTNPTPIRTCTYTKINNYNDFSAWTTLKEITVDSELSEKSANPVENKAAKKAIDDLTAIATSHRFFASGGGAVAELGITTNSTLLQLCEAIYKWVVTDKKSKVLEVSVWINQNSQIGRDVQSGLGDTNTFGNLLCVCSDSNVYLTYRTYTGGRPAPINLNTYTKVNNTNNLTGWKKINQITVDSALSTTSENPVQSKAVKAAIDALGAPVIVSATAPSNTNALWVKPGGS